MRFTTKIFAAALCAALQACVTAPAPGPRPSALRAEARTPVTILVSIDGFRPDYRTRGVTPNLDALAASGISAAMRPSFPSKTFPNHWTLVTGLRPDRNGIVSNAMEDVARPGEKFTMEDSKDPFWWNAAEPLWVTAERGGVRSATMFWPGSNVAWGGTLKGHGATNGGMRPEDWWPFDQAVPGEQRVAGVIDWLRRPAAQRPRFITLYFDTVDSAGHSFGPDAPETTEAVKQIDAQIGALVSGLRTLGQPANLIIVADHGMAATSPARTIALDSIANPADYRLFESGPFASLYAVPGHEAALERALLGHHAHYDCWRKREIPARLHYGANPRVPPYFCLAETGWSLTASTPKPDAKPGGNHGFDNAAPEMAALFIASGPAIKPLGPLPGFDNVDVAPLIRDVLGLPAGTGLDGDDAPFRAALAK
ncbi:ectonucleotide pyrophosphatase/phosphodiesterase [Sphingomonas sp. 10B4]|uniref:alkaline phosphatase family protein n=1 Tax=Sphingomonas sp. 10B4 TaxID=3048575 RepID=UPI002AB36D1F|nr:ectonucleotide pyrophosphatase/phosphodiesterase [Sphingomonas sp. 10B4]MDY7523039.1 ectonucleotide pyrophosphatase/phosphodiesterase [Sphingomonas sp. 10B4]MEB0282817.1 ectonucleotide pyrophosphatase/phosphodiesterase [Sphingomonas sp. 10B4]